MTRQLQVPQAAEAAEAERMRTAAATVQRWWRRRRWQVAVQARRRNDPGAAEPSNPQSHRSSQWGCAQTGSASSIVMSAAASASEAQTCTPLHSGFWSARRAGDKRP